MISHSLSMTTPDNPAYENQPQHWNQPHVYGYTIEGNTAGASTVTGSNIHLSAGPNQTISVNAGTIVFSGGAGAAGNTGYISGGTTNASLGTLSIADGNGLSFGINGQTLTASHNGLTSQSNQNVTAGNGGFAFQTLSFSNANGMSFGTSAGSAITGSYTVPSTAGLLSAVNLSAGTTSNNLSAVTFSNANGVSFGLNGSVITGSVAAAGGAQTGISGVGVSDTTYSSGTVIWSAQANVTLGSSVDGVSQYVRVSVAPQSAQTGISGVQVSNATYTSGTVTFQNANGISFGSSGANGISASYTVPTQTNQTVGGYFVGNTTGQSSSSTVDARSISFDGAGIVSAGWSNGSIRISATQSNQAASAANGSFAFQTLSFSNLNGISFGTSAGSAITASHNALTTARASNDGVGLNTAQTNVTWTVNSGGVSFNAGGYAGTTTGFAGANISGSMTHNTAGLNLSLSVAAPGAAAENNWVNLLGANTAGNTTASGSTIGYSGINLTLSGTNGSVVNISAPATSSISATGNASISVNGSTISLGANAAAVSIGGNSTSAGGGYSNVSSGTLVLAGGNNITLSQNGATVTISAAAGGAGATFSGFDPWQGPRLWVISQIGNASLSIRAVDVPAAFQYDRMVMPINYTQNTAATVTMSVSVGWGFYTRNGQTLSLAQSGSGSFSVNGSGTASSANNSGNRIISFGDTKTIGAGNYYLGLVVRTSSAGGAAQTLQVFCASQLTSIISGYFGVATNTRMQYHPAGGVWTSTSAVAPASLALSDILGNSSAFQRQPIFHFTSGEVTV